MGFANDNTKEYLNSLPKGNTDVDDALLKKCKSCLKESEDSIIENQKRLYKEWNQSRDTLLENEYKLLMKRSRLEAIQQTKEELAREEEKLFFFENLDKLELEKEEKQRQWRRTFPARNWSLPGYFSKSRFVTKPGEERKTARWERRELKRGPPK